MARRAVLGAGTRLPRVPAPRPARGDRVRPPTRAEPRARRDLVRSSPSRRWWTSRSTRSAPRTATAAQRPDLPAPALLHERDGVVGGLLVGGGGVDLGAGAVALDRRPGGPRAWAPATPSGRSSSRSRRAGRRGATLSMTGWPAGRRRRGGSRARRWPAAKPRSVSRTRSASERLGLPPPPHAASVSAPDGERGREPHRAAGYAGGMAMDPLLDGHGRRIGDLRVSVTDRCNFRCQYCMPAEGLPWLERDDVLHFEEIERLVALLAAMGVDRRAPDRRRAARAPRLPVPGGDARRRCVEDERHHQRLPARARRRGARARRARPLQRLDRLAAARPLLRDDPPRRPAPGAARPRGAGALPRGAPDQGQRGRHARLHRGRGAALRALRPRAPLRGALHRVHAARRRPRLDARQRPDRRGDPRDHRAAVGARARAARAARHRARLPLRRRPRLDRVHQPGLRAVLRRLQPHPPDRRRPAAHVPVLAQRDRPARAAARGRRRRRARADRPRRGVAQGAQAPRQRAGLRPAACGR